MTSSELLLLQLRVILSLVLRETRATFGTSSFGYIWAIITPTASVAVLVILFSLAGRHSPFGASLALFFATGILTLQFFAEFSSKLMTVFDANRALLTYPIIKDVDTILARAILISVTYHADHGFVLLSSIRLGSRRVTGPPGTGHSCIFGDRLARAWIWHGERGHCIDVGHMDPDRACYHTAAFLHIRHFLRAQPNAISGNRIFEVESGFASC